MAEPDLQLVTPLSPSAPAWVEAVMGDFDEFLRDHASCEKKASGMALAVASHYPDQPALLEAMAELAAEELGHYREVIKVMVKRGVVPGPDTKDPYINALNQLVRKGPANFLLDRLIVASVVERRGAERFGLIAERLANSGTEPELARFYSAIAQSESRHWTLFLKLALNHCNSEEVWPRFNDISDREAEIVGSLPLRPALH